MNVFKHGLVACFLIALAGCQSPMSDMMNNNFVAITPEPVPEGLAGSWTGNMGPYLVTMKWQSDGHGLFCYSYGTADVLQKLKFSGGKIQIQDGTKLILKEQNPESITVYAPYAAGKDTVLLTDPDYKNASGFCAKAVNT
ncbi:J517_1871 family lipoprotein [Marinobacter adhaerens]|nr:J517_1871 family lipoprotein [Marinobacter adhaerens]